MLKAYNIHGPFWTKSTPLAKFRSFMAAGLLLLMVCGLCACAREEPVDVFAPVAPARPSLAPSPTAVMQDSAYYSRMRTQADSNDFVKQQENDVLNVSSSPLSTFSIDVDTASYALVRRALEEGRMPHKGSVRVEEMINFFQYAYPAPVGKAPCTITTELTNAFWNPEHKLLRIGIKAKDIDWKGRKPSNLVFLVDSSGSMSGPDRMGLVKKSLQMLVDNMDERDTISIVTYAGSSSVALKPTSGKFKSRILEAIDKFEASGSTQGSAGIQTAYELASKNYIKGGLNRVILCTDGDFNVGVTSKDGLLELIKEKARSGVFLTVLGYGMGNYKDDMLMKLADSGNGMYAYIDTALEAKKVLVEQIGSSLITVAKDVKVQVEFNPAKVASYRLVGYEKRILEARDFNDDTKDAGEMGAGHTVTALYELVPAELGEAGASSVDPLKYGGQASRPGDAADDYKDEWCTVKVRYKEPEGEASKLIQTVVTDGDLHTEPTPDTRMATAVAAFGMLLSESKYKGSVTYEQVLEIVSDPAVSNDLYRKEFMGLVAKAVRINAQK